MDTMDYLDDDKVNALKSQVKGFLAYSWRKHIWHSRLNIIVVLAGIVSSSAVTVLGLLSHRLSVGIIGAVISSLFGIQNAFKFAEKAHFWEVKHGEAKNLRDRLSYKVRTDEDFQSRVDEWLGMKQELLDSMPRTTGLDGQKKANELAAPTGRNGK